VQYEFRNEINVTDLGLRLADVQKYELKSERCRFNGYFGEHSIATEEEQAFLRSNRRVELNAFTAPQFIEWLSAKLTEHLPNRLIPGDNILTDAYRRALALAKINQAISLARDQAIRHASRASIPPKLRRDLAKMMKKLPRAWDVALYELAESQLARESDEEE
jgi:hypothetical protein